MAKPLILIFSKERTLQLYSLIRSLTDLSDLEEADLTILYQESAEISYAPLRERVACRFIEQRNFLVDIQRIVEESDSPYVCFMVDDLIYRDAVDWATICTFLDAQPTVDAFSLRLGENIQDLPRPDFERTAGDILLWQTAGNLGTSWKYFWELMSTVYRRERVLRYLKRCNPQKVSYPNPLEGVYYRKYPSYCGGKWNLLWRLLPDSWRRNRMACFARSKCFTQGVNMVAGRDIAYDAYRTPKELHQLFLDGCVVDYTCLRDVENAKPNAGRQYFRLLDGQGNRHEASCY